MATNETAVATELRQGDVFLFVYSQQTWDRARSGIGHGDLNWCFDGQLEVQADGRLRDTYWSANDGRSFTHAEALAQGTLTFVCNLNDVDLCPAGNLRHYAPEDGFDISYQHGCYKRFAVRKGAVRNRDRMLSELDAQMRAVHEDAAMHQRQALRDIEALSAMRAKVEAGDLSVSLWSRSK